MEFRAYAEIKFNIPPIFECQMHDWLQTELKLCENSKNNTISQALKQIAESPRYPVTYCRLSHDFVIVPKTAMMRRKIDHIPIKKKINHHRSSFYSKQREVFRLCLKLSLSYLGQSFHTYLKEKRKTRKTYSTLLKLKTKHEKEERKSEEASEVCLLSSQSCHVNSS